MNTMKLLYVTCKDIEEARSITKKLVEDRLAACGNILPKMESIYQWDGEIKHESEVVLIIKTTKDRSKDCQEKIKKSHSYTTPCILELDVLDGNSDYMYWVKNQTLLP